MPSSSTLTSVRNRFREVLRDTPGVEGISITRDAEGNFALAARVHDSYFDAVQIPDRFEQFRVLKKRASDFQPQ